MSTSDEEVTLLKEGQTEAGTDGGDGLIVAVCSGEGDTGAAEAKPAIDHGLPLRKLTFCVVGIIGSFGVYGALLEALTFGGKEISELALLTVNSIICCLFARIMMLAQGEVPKSVPDRYFIAIACTYLGGMFLSIRALRYVNYPTRILAKSAKAVPIMAMNFVFGKRYTRLQYVSVMLIVSGTCIFMLFKPTRKGEGSTTTVGAALLALSLICDGTTGALEDKVLADIGWKHGEGGLDLMYNINLYAAGLTSVSLLASGGTSDFISMGLNDFGVLVILGTSLSVGQLFLFYTIANFGALVCSVVTTSRKVLQIIFSVVWFGHIIAPPQFAGLAVAIGGLMLNVHAKEASMSNKP